MQSQRRHDLDDLDGCPVIVVGKRGTLTRDVATRQDRVLAGNNFGEIDPEPERYGRNEGGVQWRRTVTEDGGGYTGYFTQ